MQNVCRTQTTLDESAAQPLANWGPDSRTIQLAPAEFERSILEVPRRLDPTIPRPGSVLERVGGELMQNEGKRCGRFRWQRNLRTRAK